MNIMKRFLALALSATFVIGGAVIASAEGTDNTYKADIELLNSLSITDIDIETFDSDAKVKRTAFADAVASMIIDNLDDYSGVARGDLTVANKGMIYLADIGIISGYGDNQFLPDNEISTFEALTILLSAMGYSTFAQIMGGYPNGYVSAANQAELLDGITFNADGTFEYKHFVKLLVNSLEANIMVLDTVGNTTVSGTYPVYKEIDETMLSKHREIYKAEGTVTANDMTGLYSARENTGSGKVVIDSVIYDDPTRVASDLLGSKIEFYYNENYREGTKVLWAKADKTTTMTIKAKNIDSFNDNKYIYYNGSRYKTEKISETVKVFYNGVYSDSADNFEPESGDVTLVDTDNDGNWDIVKIREPKYVIVQNVANEEIVYDKYDLDYNLELDGIVYDNYVIFNADGTEMDISAITNGSVLEVEAADNGYCKITIINNNVNAKILSVQNYDDGYETIVTDCGTYDVTARFNELIDGGDIKELTLNSTYKLYLNQDNEVVLAESETDGKYRTGYIRKMYYDETPLGEMVYVNMLDSSGMSEKFILADSVKLGKSKYKIGTIIENFELSNYNNKPCIYAININGKITEIYLASDNTEKIKEVYKKSDAYMYSFVSGYVFGTNTSSMEREQACSIASDAKVFYVPTDPTGKGDEYFSVVSADKIKPYVKYDIALYNTNDEIGWGDFAVIKSNIPYMKVHGIRPVIINDVKTYYDETDGEIYMKIDGFQFENAVSITVKDDREIKGECPLQSGDIAFVMTDADGKLRLSDVETEASYDLLLDYREDEEPVISAVNGKVNIIAPTYYRNINGSARLIYGAVYKAEGNRIWVNPSEDLTKTNLVEAFDCSNSKVYVYKYNEEKEVFEKIPVKQAIGYENDAVNYNKAFIYTTDSSYALVVLY